MDVDAAVQRLVDALELSDRHEAADAADAIVAWMNRGGFSPKIEHHTMAFILAKFAEILRN